MSRGITKWNVHSDCFTKHCIFKKNYSNAVVPLHNDQLGDRKKWPLKTVGRYGEGGWGVNTTPVFFPGLAIFCFSKKKTLMLAYINQTINKAEI